MKKISYLLLGVVAVSIFVGNNTFADWDGGARMQQMVPQDAPVWPMPYTDANVDAEVLSRVQEDSNAIDDGFSSSVSVEPDIGWTGGPSYTPPGGNPPVVEGIIPPDNSNMPLANQDLIIDDGVRTLSASMPPGYPLIEQIEIERVIMETDENLILQDSVRDWVAREGMSLREVLQQWADVEGWELVWNTKREYPLEASAIFRGRFKDVSAAIVRNFAKAAPRPLARYYLGNRVLVVKTLEGNDGN